MDELKIIYDNLWEKSINGFEQCVFDFDSALANKNVDKRRGLTLIGHLNGNVLSKIMEFLDEGKSIEPNQYFYKETEIHITIMSVITCYDDFNVTALNINDYQELISSLIKGIGPIEINFEGITASSSCIMLQGFPVNDALATIRGRLRNGFKNSLLFNSIDQRYLLQTAHSTIIRLKVPVFDKDEFLRYLNKYREYQFGTVEVDKIEFVYNDWYMTDSIVKTLGQFSLKGMP